MSTLSHDPAVAPEKRPWVDVLLVTHVWASLAIAVMWIAVAVSTVWGPDFVSNSGPGGSSTTIPSGVAVAMFASIGTWAVARYGFGHREGRTD